MTVILAVVVGGLFAASVYLLLQRSIVKLALGLSLIGNAANLLIFTAAGIVRGEAPLVPVGADRPAEGAADPLAQALILTAIVIGFGVLAFTLVLLHRAYQETRSDDLDELSSTDR